MTDVIPVLVIFITLLVFIMQEIDGKALLLLPANALEALTENKLGPITKLMDALQSLKKMWGLHS